MRSVAALEWGPVSRARVRRPLLALIVLLLALAIGYGIRSLHSRWATPTPHATHAARAGAAGAPLPGWTVPTAWRGPQLPPRQAG